jgi:hypothetical protein
MDSLLQEHKCIHKEIVQEGYEMIITFFINEVKFQLLSENQLFYFLNHEKNAKYILSQATKVLGDEHITRYIHPQHCHQ